MFCFFKVEEVPELNFHFVTLGARGGDDRVT